MAHYIDKDAVVAEIDERIKAWKEFYDDMRNAECYTLASGVYLRIDELEDLKRFLNTLEVKEVDSEKEADEMWNYVFSELGCDENTRMAITHKEFMALTKHFFELGVKAIG